MKKDQLYADLLQRGIKENKSTVKKSLKYRSKVEMQNRVRNAIMDKDNKKSLSCFTETATWRFLRPIKTPVVEPQNGFTVARAPKVPDESEVRVTVNHDFSETFEKDQLDGKQLAKVGCIILPRACANFILTISLTFSLFSFILHRW